MSPIRQLITRAEQGEQLVPDEIGQLLAIPLVSEEAYYIQYLARKMSSQAAVAEIHGQVGVNTAACPGNCTFCSFAAANKVFGANRVAPIEKIVRQALELEQQGANAVYLMATANMDFAEYIEIAQEVGRQLQPTTVLVANFRDFDYGEGLALKDAGFIGIYHAVRMGEGRDTRLSVEQRLATIQIAQEVGLQVGTCVEPIGPEHSQEEIIEKILLTREVNPVFSGAMRRINLPGTVLAEYGMISEMRMAHIVAVTRLAIGLEIPGNCNHEPNVPAMIAGCNLIWAEAGSNPRDTSEDTEESRGYTVEKCRELFKEAEIPVLSGPSQMFRL